MKKFIMLVCMHIRGWNSSTALAYSHISKKVQFCLLIVLHFAITGYPWKWGKLSVPVKISEWNISWSHSQAFQTSRRRSTSQPKQVFYLDFFIITIFSPLTIYFYFYRDINDKESVSYTLRESLFDVMRVYINLVHDYNETCKYTNFYHIPTLLKLKIVLMASLSKNQSKFQNTAFWSFSHSNLDFF